MNRIIFALLLCSCTGAFAQTADDLSAKRLEMVKKAVQFYSTLPELGNAGTAACAGKASVDEVADCAAGLKGVQAKVRSWGARTLNNAEDLDRLKATILRDIAAPNPARAAMPAYKKMQADLDALTATAAGPPPAAPAPQDTAPQQSTDAAGLLTDTGAPAIPANAPVPAAAVEVPAEKPSGTNWLLLLVPALLALGAAAYAHMATQKLRRQFEKNLRQDRLEDQEQKSTVRADAGSAPEVVQLRLEVKKLADQIKELQQKSLAAPTIAAMPAAPLMADGYNAPHTVQATPGLYYAKYADAADGFTASSLSKESDDKKVFELNITSATRGTYRISPNPTAHRVALNDTTTFLGRTTKYSSMPQPGSRIVTETPGTVSLQGGVWVIESPAVISFV